jgi:DNA repair exonuclease SbcCD nuclease subunit
MKILLFTDLHMCPRASIINKWGTKYPLRLENCIKSVNWLERLAEAECCNYIINLGDFFDKPDLSSETITASKDIIWSEIPHYSIVGNHDASTSSLIFNSVNSFLGSNHSVITEPTVLELMDCYLCFLPYVVECDRKPISEYFTNLNKDKPRVILSHNDISGIQLGPVMSKTGFSISELETACDLMINGHLHNGQALSSKIYNLGNLTGKDFGEDAAKYSHNIAILDTSTLQLTFIENPYAFNFYKLQLEKEEDLECLSRLKTNAVLSLKCDSLLLDKVKLKLDSLGAKVVESRIIIAKNYDNIEAANQELELSVDHLARFVECCKSSIENTALLDEELGEICK